MKCTRKYSREKERTQAPRNMSRKVRRRGKERERKGRKGEKSDHLPAHCSNVNAGTSEGECEAQEGGARGHKKDDTARDQESRRRSRRGSRISEVL